MYRLENSWHFFRNAPTRTHSPPPCRTTRVFGSVGKARFAPSIYRVDEPGHTFPLRAVATTTGIALTVGGESWPVGGHRGDSSSPIVSVARRSKATAARHNNHWLLLLLTVTTAAIPTLGRSTVIVHVYLELHHRELDIDNTTTTSTTMMSIDSRRFIGDYSCNEYYS